MGWVRIDDGFADHPKIARVGPFGTWMQIQALCYANKNLTDGFIPFAVARGFMARADRIDGEGRIWTTGEFSGVVGHDPDDTDWPELLVEVGIWEPRPGGYQIHDYPEYQLTKAEILAIRGATRARVERHRGRRNAVTNTVGNAVGNGVGNRPPNPNPNPKEEDLQKSVVVVKGVRGKRRADRAAPLPTDFTFTEERRKFAEAGGVPDPGLEFAAFKDHHRAKGSLMYDWEAAWKNWCRNAVKYAQQRQRR
jgi:hypothetical protein